jgi:hypothetical protein
MADALDVLAVLDKDDFHWIGFARTHDEAASVIRNHGRPGLFLVHSQITGRKIYFRAESPTSIVQLTGPPPELI